MRERDEAANENESAAERNAPWQLSIASIDFAWAWAAKLDTQIPEGESFLAWRLSRVGVKPICSLNKTSPSRAYRISEEREAFVGRKCRKRVKCYIKRNSNKNKREQRKRGKQERK